MTGDQILRRVLASVVFVIDVWNQKFIPDTSAGKAVQSADFLVRRLRDMEDAEDKRGKPTS